MPHPTTDVSPETDKDSSSLFAGDQNPNAGDPQLTQGPNWDDAPLNNGVPLLDRPRTLG